MLATIASPPMPPIAADAADEELRVAADDEESPSLYATTRELLRMSNSVLVALTLHLLAMVALAFWTLPDLIRDADDAQVLVIEASPVHDPGIQTSLDMIDVTSLNSVALAATSPTVGERAEVLTLSVASPLVDSALVERLDDDHPRAVEGELRHSPDLEQLLGRVTKGSLGDPHEVVDDYPEALDRLTQEILLMLDERDLLLIWLFDQSASMKDDQQDIRERLEIVYGELGQKSQAAQGRLVTAVASYGAGVMFNTPQPTDSIDEIRGAIDSIPVDPSGQEMMCQAMAHVISNAQPLARAQDRGMAVILVTDKAGRMEDRPYLEATIALAKQAHCRIYVLGREAVFGRPKAQMKWVHPETGGEYWLPVDRGPEAAVVEQLQTDGFRARDDAYPSGFGPWEQCRLVRETGGVFFMLPSPETNLWRKESQQYDLRALSWYQPDWKPREVVMQELAASRFRSVLVKIINDLNPYRPEVAKVMEVRLRYAATPEEFAKQAAAEQAKAQLYLTYLDQAAQALEQIKPLRADEPAPRWQANYDLIYAQVLAYTARTYEYIAVLDDFLRHPRAVPLTKPDESRPRHWKLSGWDVNLDEAAPLHALTRRYVDRSREMFADVIDQHAGTPWASRAAWELQRGFGFVMADHYRYVAPPPPPVVHVAGKARANGPNAKPGAASRPRPAPAPAKPVITIPKAL